MNTSRSSLAFARLSWLPAILWLATTFSAAGNEPQRLLLLSQSADGHPASTHEYVAGLKRVAKSLEATPRLQVELVNADEPWAEGPELLTKCDGAVLFLAEGARWSQADPRRAEALARLTARGGGLSALHWALGTKKAEPIEPFVKLLGGCHGGADRKYQVLETEVRVVDATHPILRGFEAPGFRARDEFYYRLKFASAGSVQPLLQALIDGQPETVAWCWQRPDGGRSFGFTGLHFDENWQLPEYQRLITQGVLWTMKR